MSITTTATLDAATDTTITAPTEYKVEEFEVDGVTPMTWRGPTTTTEGWAVTPIIDANGSTVFEIRVDGDEAAGLLTASNALALAMRIITEAGMAEEAADAAKAKWGY